MDEISVRLLMRLNGFRNRPDFPSTSISGVENDEWWRSKINCRCDMHLQIGNGPDRTAVCHLFIHFSSMFVRWSRAAQVTGVRFTIHYYEQTPNRTEIECAMYRALDDAPEWPQCSDTSENKSFEAATGDRRHTHIAQPSVLFHIEKNV